jgi:hypothetical protein
MPAAPARALAARPLIARLPGLMAQVRHTLSRVRRRLTRPYPPHPVFHITHQKAGSQWLRRILEELSDPWVVLPKPDASQVLSESIQLRRVYPTVYITREQFETVSLPPHARSFVVIRDLRDTLVSAYFSLKVSHKPLDSEMTNYRAMLQTLGQEEGLIRMIKQVCCPIAAIQRSWLDGPYEVLKYEDLLVRDEEILSRVLLDHCRIPVSRDFLSQIVAANRFESRTGGRQRGAEDVGSHERKGIAGDWRNHFTDRVARVFKERYGDLLVATGYETGFDW